MKHKIFCVALGACLAMSLATTSMAATFTDMPDNYATTSLEAAVENGLLTGTNDGQILPDQNLTRAEMATIMVRALGGSQEADISGFADMATEAWYDSYMATAVYMEIFQGDGTNLNPTQPITRQEAAVVLARAFHLSAEDSSVLDSFGDENEISAWAAEYVAAMVEAGFIQGDNLGDFNPTDAIKRQDFAVIMDRMIDTYVTEADTYTTQLDGSVMINVPDVTLKDMTITGDLIIGDGVGEGDVILENVIVEGRTIIRGGGVNCIIVKGSSTLGTTIVGKVGGEVRVTLEDDSVAESVYVVENKTEVYIEGTVNSLAVEASSVVNFIQGVSNDINLVGEEAIVILGQGAEVVSATINGDATGAAVIVADGATVDTVTVEAAEATVSVESSATVATVAVAEEATGAAVTVTDGATVETVTVEATEATVSVESSATVATVAVAEAATGAAVTVADGATVDYVSVEASESTVVVDSNATVDTVAVQEVATAVTVVIESDATVATVATAAAETVVVNNGTVDSVTFTESASDSTYVVGETASTDTTVTAATTDSLTITTEEAYVAAQEAAAAEQALQDAVDAGASEEEIAQLESEAADAAAQAESAATDAADTVTNVTDSVVEDTTVTVPDTTTDSTTDSSTSSGSSSSSTRSYYVQGTITVPSVTSNSIEFVTSTYSVSSSGSGDQGVTDIISALVSSSENKTLVINGITALTGSSFDVAVSGGTETITVNEAFITAAADYCVAKWAALTVDATASDDYDTVLSTLTANLAADGITATAYSTAGTILADTDGILYGNDGITLLTLSGALKDFVAYYAAEVEGWTLTSDYAGTYADAVCNLSITIVRS